MLPETLQQIITDANYTANSAWQIDIAPSGALLNTYFNDTMRVRLAPHDIYPPGTCIGGRNSGYMADPVLKKSSRFAQGDVFGFMNVASGKKGLIYIRTDQAYYWDMRFWIDGNGTYVDIIKQL